MKHATIKILIITYVFYLSIGIAKANDNYSAQIKIIKELYTEANRLEKEPGFQHEVTMNTVLPAIGHRKTTVQFVFSSSQINPEKKPYLIKYSLKKVIIEYNIAASQQHHYEYLYNHKGDPVFGYHKIDGIDGEFEYRFYFHKKKLLTTKVMKSPVKENASNFTSSNQKMAKEILQKANKYFFFFNNLVELQNIK